MNRFVFGFLALPLMLGAQTQDLTPEKKEFFEGHIRPVLAQQCFVCHTNSKMGGLRLDSREAILQGGKSGPAVIPGEPDKSVLITAIRQTGAIKMPKGASPMSNAQINDLATWVKDGAYWPADAAPRQAGLKSYVISSGQRKFWSFQPLSQPSPPKVKNAAWATTAIDRFILARLEKEDLKPSPLADRRTLLRRITYDLTGLPPTYEEVVAFEADKSPTAYEKVVDRLLASPRYGELWARHWLDVVRYGEDDYRIAEKTNHAEKYLQAYTYRDWVVNSLNQDLPYDKFVKAQIAGDLMDEKVRVDMIPGLGMNGLGVWQFNDNPPAIERAEEWHDKVDVTTKTFLGLTVGCARCHDHKYDPIPTKDYYRLASVFASTSYHAYPLVPKDKADEYDKQKKELEEKEKGLKEFLDEASALYARVLLAQTEDYMVAAWRVGSQKRATVSGVAEESKVDSEILERWVKFLKKKPSNYTFLKPWQEMVASGGTVEAAKKLAHEFYVKALEIDKLHAKIKAENEVELAKFKEEEKVDMLPNGIKRKLLQHQIDLKGMDREQSYLWTDMFDHDLLESTGNDNAVGKRPPGLLKLAEWGLEKRLSPDLSAHVTRLKGDIDAFKKAMPQQYPFVYGVEDNKEPADLKVLVRGNPYSFGEDAPRGFLSVLSESEPKSFTKGSGRLELAEEIVKQPIATRVIVNRIWRWHMGTGLVDTPSNFGLAGERPTNPELLEYLASKFIAGGMSIKKLHKEILMSRTYQLSSTTIEANAAKDSDNRLYWRSNRRRLEAEGIWDSLLTASGKLNLSKIGGPSEELADGMTRRGMYGKVSRVFPNDFQVTFDFPTATISCERRYATNVPQQRLFFLNNEFVHKQAEALAERVRGAGSEEAQVKKAFAIAYQRQPTADDLSASLDLLHDQTGVTPASTTTQTAWIPSTTAAGFAAKPEAAAAAVAPSAEPQKPAKSAASPLKSLCWALLSSNEFLYLN
jgi:hypothetical protein